MGMPLDTDQVSQLPRVAAESGTFTMSSWCDDPGGDNTGGGTPPHLWYMVLELGGPKKSSGPTLRGAGPFLTTHEERPWGGTDLCMNDYKKKAR